MRDYPVAFEQEEHHLIVPVIRAQRPTVVKHNGRRVFRPPIFVKNPGAVFGYNFVHGVYPLAI
ncbi:hypothetical protein D3C85_1491270 [compost metagenome]